MNSQSRLLFSFWIRCLVLPIVVTVADDTAPLLPCTICADRSSVQNADTDLTPFLVEHYPSFPVVPGLENTCDFVDTFLLPYALTEGDGSDREDGCDVFRVVFGGLCGCPPIAEDYCVMCPNDEEVPLPEVQYSGLIAPNTPKKYLVMETCGQYNLMANQVRQGDHLCRDLQGNGWACGCNEGKISYLGADTQLKKAILAWAPRLPALLSLLGSVYIMFDVLFRASQRTLYHELLFGVSLYDFIGSTSLMFSTAPIPKYWLGYTDIIYGAIGNDATCTTQGFFLQMGLAGGMFYILMLCIFFVLTIVYNYRGQQLKKMRLWMHSIPNIASVASAFAGLQRYGSILLFCHIKWIAEDKFDGFVLFFSLSVFLVLSGSTAFLLFLYCRVRKTERVSLRWSARSTHHLQSSPGRQLSKATVTAAAAAAADESSSPTHADASFSTIASSRPAQSRLEAAVFWRAMLYILSFWMTFPLIVIAQLFKASLFDRFGFWVFFLTFSPLQGFYNFLIYRRQKNFRRGTVRGRHEIQERGGHHHHQVNRPRGGRQPAPNNQAGRTCEDE